jgi:hypothetical protein
MGMLVEIRRGTGRATARQCQVPKELLDEWVLAEGGTYRLRAGQAVTEAEVHGQRGLTARGPVIHLGRDCFDELHLPWDITLNLRRRSWLASSSPWSMARPSTGTYNGTVCLGVPKRRSNAAYSQARE